MARVDIRGCVKSYGMVEVLKGLDLAIEDGEFVVLIGPSGCGKSTALRIVAGLETSNGGSIGIGDRQVDALPPKDRNIAMVFQNYALYPQMTARENIAFSLNLRKWRTDAVDGAVGKAAHMLGLHDYLARLPRELSGGQRQRVAMGRALVRSPDVFLFDEPLSNLDAKLRTQMRVEIKRLHQDLRTTTIYVTHDQIEAMTLADRIVVMNAGKIEQVGPPLELYDHPDNVFVAGFLGSPSMNFLPGHVSGQQVIVEGEVLLGDLPGGSLESEVMVGIRPEHLQIGDRGITAIVQVVEVTGSETQVHAHIGEYPVVVVTKERAGVRAGDQIRLMPDVDRLHFFSRVNGQRLKPLASAETY